MPAPTAALTVPNPAPLNSTTFPYAVQSIDWQWLASFAGLVNITAPVNTPDPAPLPANAFRFSYGS